ncbi:MAG: large conductance mechanosensitive channel protein MscL [Proteobacteria bacterium]|nr:large conductance mechanosensitive channel protein MscL [Cystobacterineae bacterium]MCL2313657.1 large conductance mechanosensitive channel protein MscL [Pseudomonadota bacterium]
MFKEFRTFIARGNAVEMAIGIVVGAAFGKIVNSLVDDILMPPVGLLLGEINFKSWFVALNGQSYATLEAAKAAHAPVLSLGNFVNTTVEFFIVAFCIFMAVKSFNKLSSEAKTAAGRMSLDKTADKPESTPK